MIKKTLIFVACLAPWFLTSIIPADYSYYDSLILPFFALPKVAFPIIWTILYILIAISMYGVFSTCSFKETPKSYKRSLIINYLFNQSFTIFFFLLKNNFLGFISCLGTFISSLFLYHETFKINEKSTTYLDLYVLFNLFASILSLTIYIMNTM